MPSHIETINNLNQSVLTAGAAPPDVQGFTKTLEAMYKEGDPEVRKGLAQLRKNLEPRLAGQASDAAHESWRKLADELDRNLALAYSPEEGIARVMNVTRSAVNRYLLFERENMPALSDAHPAVQILGRTGVFFAARGAVLAGTLVAGGAAFYAVRSVWRGLKYAISHPIGAMSTVTGAILAGGALGAAMRNYLPENILRHLPSWFTRLPAVAPQPDQKQTAEQIKTLQDQRQKQGGITDGILSDLQSTPVDDNARRALVAIQTEIGQIESIPAVQRQQALVGRLKFLNDERQRIEKLLSPDEVKKLADERKKQAEDETKAAEEKVKNDAAKRAQETKEMTKQFNDILMGIAPGPLLTNPPRPPLTVGNMEVTLGPTSIFITRNGARFRMDAQMEVSGIRHSFDLTRMERRVVNVPAGIIQAARTDHNIGFTELPQAYRTAASWSSGKLLDGVDVAEVSRNLAQAAVVFQGGENEYSKEFSIPFTLISFGTLHVNLIPA